MKKSIKRIIILITSFVFLIALFPFETHVQATAFPFTDVSPNAWYYYAVVYAYDSGLMNGTTSTTFCPNDTLPREQAVTVIGRLAEKFGCTIPMGSTTLSDVEYGRYYYKYVCWAVNHNLIDHPSGSFGVGQPITRQDLAFLLYNTCNYTGLTIKTLIPLPNFSDDNMISNSKRVAVYKCARGNIMVGSGGAFHPWSSLKRSEMAQVITNYVAYHKNDYAYVIGCNYADGGPQNVQNVEMVAACYDNIPGLDVRSMTYPTSASMTAFNPVHFYRIGSSVIFGNGHASARRMTFIAGGNQNNKTGFAIDPTESNVFAKICNTDMRGVRLISFVGCHSASNNENLCTVSVDQGAKCAVGFDDFITSTSSANRMWLQTYSQYLAENYSVSYAIAKASQVPNSDLGDSVIIEGAPWTQICPNSSLPSSASSPQGIESEQYPVSARFNNEESITNALLSDYADRFENIIAEIQKIEPSFKASDYRVSFHIVSPEDNWGLIQLKYCIGDNKEIFTNRVYTFETLGSKTTHLHNSSRPNDYFEDIKVNEHVKYLKQQFLSTGLGRVLVDETTKPINAPFINRTENYYYNYETGQLHYVEVNYYQDGTDGVVIDRVKEIVIE